jgi:hypothetical protein
LLGISFIPDHEFFFMIIEFFPSLLARIGSST